MLHVDGSSVYVADDAATGGLGAAGGGMGDLHRVGTDGFSMSSAQFEQLFADFLMNFKLNGESIYKEDIRKLRTALVSDGLAEGNPSGWSTGNRSNVASIRLDIEHLAKWRPSFTGGGRDEENNEDHETMSQASSDVSELFGRRNLGEAMMQALRRHPLKYIPSSENAIKKALTALALDETGEATKQGFAKSGNLSHGPSADSMFQNIPNVQVEIISRERPIKIRDLKAGEVEALTVIPGIVVQAGKPQHKATLLKVQCKDCKTEKYVRIPPWRQSVALPRICDAPQSGDEKCGFDPYILLSDESQYSDVQQIKLQELPEDVPTGDMPRHLNVNCARALCGRVIPGERVLVVGVFSSFETHDGGRRGAGSSEGVKASYVHGLGMEYMESSTQRKHVTWTYREEEEFRRMSQDPEIVDKISQSIAPAIFGLEDVKKAVACLLFGGSRKMLPDNTKVRGDINVLLLGDPSTAKSQFLKFVDKCAPIAVYTSGKGSSAAGLTAAIVRDASGNFALEGGAMVLADGGVVCIDEFDKMRDDDRVAIHEAMEQQTISIAKAGITTVLCTKCSVLAAANPTFGSYDDSKDTTEQHDFETTILSRFDMIWVIRDEKSIERDKTIAKHVFALHAGAADAHAFEGPIPTERLRQYVSYCRACCDPRLSESSARKLENYYVEVREACRSDSRRRRDQIPITVRQLESLARISESLAKMSLSFDVQNHHVDEAIRLFQMATVEASKSSVSQENLTPEERQLIKAAEDMILRRLPLNARASKATIVRDLSMKGHEARHVSRAIRILVQKAVLEERGDASVKRVPALDL